MRRGVGFVLVAAVVGVLGCSRSGGSAADGGGGGGGAAAQGASRGTSPAGSHGALLVPGHAADLRTSPDGRWASFLLDAKKPRGEGVPRHALVGPAHLVPTAGGPPRKLGDGVTNAPGGLLFSPDSRHVLFLTGYDVATQSGALHVLPLGDTTAAPEQVGQRVSYFVASADGAQLAFVDGGALRVGPLPRGPFREVEGGVVSAHFTPDGKTLLYRRTLAGNGALVALALGGTGAPRVLAEQVGDWALSPDGTRLAYQARPKGALDRYDLFVTPLAPLAPRAVAERVLAFAFSPDSKWLARTESAKVGEATGALVVGPADGGKGRAVGERVGPFTFAPDARAIAALEKYDPTASAGLLGVAELPDGKMRRVGNRVPNFEWSPDARHVAFLSRFLKPMYSVDLMHYALGQEKASKVHTGVFGYGFDAKTGRLLMRTNCVRDGRECKLKALDLAAPAGSEAETWAEGVFSYRASPDGARLLLTKSRLDMDAHDLWLLDPARHDEQRVDEGAQLPALFAAKDGTRLVYLVVRGDRPGVYAGGPTAPRAASAR